jgi:site-specific recombinase XerD
MQEKTSTTQGIDNFIKALQGQNFSPKTIRAYHDDLTQFAGWLQSIRVDWDNPRRLGKQDIEVFLHHLSSRNLTGVSRARKLAAIRKFFVFLNESGVIQANPAAAVKGARREEKEPAILLQGAVQGASLRGLREPARLRHHHDLPPNRHPPQRTRRPHARRYRFREPDAHRPTGEGV